MITVAGIPATTAPPTMNRSANTLLMPCAMLTATHPSREMGEEEEHAEPIMRHEADVV
jgi:hypothetical protein